VLVRQSSSPGELVVDPFLGSGTTGVSAVSAGRRFGGCDLDPATLAIARTRLVEAGGRESATSPLADHAGEQAELPLRSGASG
jgi:DNA modification methylase